MNQLTTIQDFETLLQQHTALFYQLHQQETAERFRRQALRGTLVRVLKMIQEVQEDAQEQRANNLLTSLCVRSATLKHQIDAASLEIRAMAEREELAEQCYEDTFQQLETLLHQQSYSLAIEEV